VQPVSKPFEPAKVLRVGIGGILHPDHKYPIITLLHPIRCLPDASILKEHPNMPIQFIGELAALGTALMFAFGSTLFTISGREVGSSLVNRARLLMAVVLVMGLHWLLQGTPIPVNPGEHALFWLALSGFVGLVLGDASLFQAFVIVGPRIAMLMMALAPVLGAILAWIFLGETLRIQEIVGIIITISGIGIVVSERRGKPAGEQTQHENRYYLIGLLFGLGGALGQAGGLILSKIGMANDFPAISASLIRMVSAAVIIWAFTALRGEVISSFRTLKVHVNAVKMMIVASLTGPTIGVWLSLVAVQHAPVGVASTLMSLTPIFLIPISYIVFHEKATRRAVIGTVIAVAGTALLFL
jgi:drug/metabolite transporter (DMT)-like permease